jgi:hypothetical protein
MRCWIKALVAILGLTVGSTVGAAAQSNLDSMKSSREHALKSTGPGSNEPIRQADGERFDKIKAQDSFAGKPEIIHQSGREQSTKAEAPR